MRHSGNDVVLGGLRTPTYIESLNLPAIRISEPQVISSDVDTALEPD